MHAFSRNGMLSAAALTMATALSGCATMDGTPVPTATGELLNGSRGAQGTVQIYGRGPLLRVTILANGLTPGPHAVHIHAVGQCQGPDFQTAGGHWNPDNRQHGLANPMGAHRGDLPQVVANAEGNATAEFTVRANLRDMMDADGASFIIHAGADDDRTDPSGNSGARQLCAVMHNAR